MSFKNLFSPIHIGAMKVKNRFVVPPMGTNYATSDGFVTQQMIDYYTARAKGGFGLIIVEITAVDPLGKAIPNQIGIWNDAFIPGLKNLADAVHENSAKVIAQLHHAGRQASPDIIGAQPVAPSPIPCPFRRVVPRELTLIEIYENIEKFGDAAHRAEEAGYDGVEVHGAHGYLIGQFMSAHSNKRTDEFGGDITSRMKFPLEIMKNIRKKTKKDFAVVFRFSGDERIQDGVDVHQAKIIAKMMEDASVDAFHVSTGVYGSRQWMIAPSAVPPGYNLYTAAAVKSAVKVPVIAVGRINDPLLAESIIESGYADLVSIGRQSLADPEFPNKISENKIDEIAPCIACEQSCIGYLHDPAIGKISCLVNPLTGHEGSIKILPAQNPKKIMVIGAGPAGLLASWIAAMRGHCVVCYEKKYEIGGEFRIASHPPAKQEIAKAIKYYKTMCDKYNVSIKLNTEVCDELIRSEKPDVVIIATGSSPLLPKIEGIENPKFVYASDVLDGKATVGQKVLIAGGGLIGAETAHFLGERNYNVTIVEKLLSIAADMQSNVRYFLMAELEKYKTIMVTGAEIKRFSDDGVFYDKSGEAHLEGFDTIVLAMGTQPYNPLEEKAKELVKVVHVIGDAKKAGRANAATEDALRVAAII